MLLQATSGRKQELNRRKGRRGREDKIRAWTQTDSGARSSAIVVRSGQ